MTDNQNLCPEYESRHGTSNTLLDEVSEKISDRTLKREI